MTVFIEKERLVDQLNESNVRIIDCRFQLGKPDQGKVLYKESHISGAVYFHLEQDLSGKIQEHGGRHPLPNMDDFQQTLEKSGITNKTTVVVYDDGDSAFATRCWWLLKYVGHERVYILNGGYKEWIQANYPISPDVPMYEEAVYRINVQRDMLATVKDIQKAIEKRDHCIIDSRDEERYLGIEEPIDKKAGHIPTAANYLWSDTFYNGRIRTSSEQEKRFKGIEKSKPIIVYCGSGITATPNYIALKEAGYSNVKLYAGSFSDWISYDENEVATGNKPEIQL